jgi:hypothetical protein
MENELYCAFDGHRLVAEGPIATVLRAVRAGLDAGSVSDRVLFFATATGRQVDFDLRGTPDEVVARQASAAAAGAPGRGRPKLGVTSREITLLPRHWDWLGRQPQGASGAIRRLVDAAILADAGKAAPSVDAVWRLMNAVAGDLPGFEEASRRLYRGDTDGFRAIVADWPADLRAFLTTRLAASGSSDGVV